jgi:hypothetical protein
MAPPPRGRFGLFGPVPHYSTTTRKGTRVSVGGCCLPLPIGCLTVVASAAMAAASVAARRRL